VAQLKLDRRWGTTKDCADVTLAASRSFCVEVHRLLGEHAAAETAARLDAELRRLNVEIMNLRADGAGQEPEPQVKILSVLTGQDMSVVRAVLSVGMALFVEIGSGFGLYLALHHSLPTPSTATPPATIATPRQPPQQPIARTIDHDIERFALARLMACRSGVVTASILFADYRAWCAGQQRPPLDAGLFDHLFAALATDVGIGRTRDGYVGIGLRTDLPSNTQISDRPMLGAS
jgi:hypothetical protein